MLKILQEMQDTKPPLVLNAKLHHFRGSIIALLFKEVGQVNVSSSLQSLSILLSQRQNILIQLTLDREPKSIMEQFKSLISSLPADFEVKLLDAYETDASTLLILQMNWESWARILNPEFKIIGIIFGTSLVNLPSPGYDVANENIHD